MTRYRATTGGTVAPGKPEIEVQVMAKEIDDLGTRHYLASTLGNIVPGEPAIGVNVSEEIAYPGERYLTALPGSPNAATLLDKVLGEAQQGPGLLTGILCSFWYYERFDFTTISKHVPLILDSGAFSAYTQGGEVSLEDYAEWCHSIPRPYDFAFNLDVLGDPAASLDNWRALRSLGVVTTPVIHFGDRPEEVVPAYLNEGADRLALGGVAVGLTPQALAWLGHVFRWLREEGLADRLPVHGLGIHMRSRAARLPWATTDSSSFTAAWRYARLSLWDPERRRWATMHLNGREAFRHGRLIRLYGFEPEQVAVSSVETRDALVRLVTRSEIRAALDFPARGGSRYLAGPVNYSGKYVIPELGEQEV